jgi:hypothetical protein
MFKYFSASIAAPPGIYDVAVYFALSIGLIGGVLAVSIAIYFLYKISPRFHNLATATFHPIASAVATNIGMRELTLYTGLGLTGYGLYQIYPPAAFIIPGAVIVYVAIFGVR